MPSFWELVCVNRQKYSANANPQSKRRPRPKTRNNQPIADYHPRPEQRLYRADAPIREEAWRGQEAVYQQHHHQTSGPMVEIDGDEALRQNTDCYVVPRTPSTGPHLPHQPLAPTDQRSSRDRASDDDARDRKEGRRRHVQDIFNASDDGSQARNNVRATSSGSYDFDHDHKASAEKKCSKARSSGDGYNSKQGSDGVNRRHKGKQEVTKRPSSNSQRSSKSSSSQRPESMYQYTPRFLNDDNASAALFGGCLDDFVHNPDWNRNINHFAASPTTSPTHTDFSEGNLRSSSDESHHKSSAYTHSGPSSSSTVLESSSREKRSGEEGCSRASYSFADDNEGLPSRSENLPTNSLLKQKVTERTSHAPQSNHAASTDYVRDVSLRESDLSAQSLTFPLNKHNNFETSYEQKASDDVYPYPAPGVEYSDQRTESETSNKRGLHGLDIGQLLSTEDDDVLY